MKKLLYPVYFSCIVISIATNRLDLSNLTILAAREEELCGQADSCAVTHTGLDNTFTLQCSCDKNKCKLEGNCCLSALDNLPSVEELRKTYPMTCGLNTLLPTILTLDGVRLFRHCLSNMDRTIQSKCEQPHMFDDFYTKVPVIDINTLYSYQNKFCAKCNYVNNDALLYWDVNLRCSEVEDLIIADITTLVDDVNSNNCNLKYTIPNIPGTDTAFCSTGVISQCNETGVWKDYDPDIEAACLAYSGLFTANKIKYRNVFCYHCNVEIVSESMDNCSINDDLITERPFAYSALLKLSTLERDTEITRSDSSIAGSKDQIYDPVLVSF